jgi:hypothetical protein
MSVCANYESLLPPSLSGDLRRKNEVGANGNLSATNEMGHVATCFTAEKGFPHPIDILNLRSK